MNRIKHFLKIYLVTGTAGALVAILILARREYSPDQIAVIVAVPFMILQLIPYLLLKIPHEHHEHQATSQKDLLKGRTIRTRTVLRLTLVMLGCAALMIVVAICILGSLPVYYAVGLNWAIKPGAKIGIALLLIAGGFPAGLLAGAYTAMCMKDADFWRLLSGVASTQGERIERIRAA